MLKTYPFLTCNSSSVRFSPSSFATLLRFLNEIFPCEKKQQQQYRIDVTNPSIINFFEPS